MLFGFALLNGKIHENYFAQYMFASLVHLLSLQMNKPRDRDAMDPWI